MMIAESDVIEDLRAAGMPVPPGCVKVELSAPVTGLIVFKFHCMATNEQLATFARVLARRDVVKGRSRCDGRHIGHPCADPDCWVLRRYKEQQDGR